MERDLRVGNPTSVQPAADLTGVSRSLGSNDTIGNPKDICAIARVLTRIAKTFERILTIFKVCF